MLNFRMYAIVAAAAFAFGGFSGGKLAYHRGYSKAESEFEKVLKAKQSEYQTLKQACLNVETKLTLERDNARAEVDKVNAATREAELALLKEFQADKKRLEKALVRYQQSEKAALDSRAIAETNLLNAREIINNALDKCVRADMPANLWELLDATASTVRPAGLRDGGMPATPDHQTDGIQGEPARLPE